MSNADSDGREYREGNKSFIDYNGYKYKYSNPLKCNNGRNWKCINSRCIATLKTELNKEGNVTYSTRFTHDHEPNVITIRKRKSSLKKKDSASSSASSSSSNNSSTYVSQVAIKAKLANGTGCSKTPNKSGKTSASSSQTAIPDLTKPKINTIDYTPSLFSTPSLVNTPVLGTTATPADQSSFFSNMSTIIDWNKTPVTHAAILELKKQNDALVQEIVNREIEKDKLMTKIDKLQEKSDHDDELMKRMVESIRILELQVGTSTKKSTQPPPKKPIISSPQKVNEVEILHEIRNIDGKRIKLIGDSHIRNLKDFMTKLLPCTTSVDVNFKPGGRYEDISRFDTPPQSVKYDGVFVMAGTNDVCQSIWYQVENAIRGICDQHKPSQVYFILTPLQMGSPTTNKYIRIFNNSIKDVVCTIANATCIETVMMFKHYDYCADGIHLNRQGKFKLCRTLVDYVIHDGVRKSTSGYKKVPATRSSAPGKTKSFNRYDSQQVRYGGFMNKNNSNNWHYNNYNGRPNGSHLSDANLRFKYHTTKNYYSNRFYDSNRCNDSYVPRTRQAQFMPQVRDQTFREKVTNEKRQSKSAQSSQTKQRWFRNKKNRQP